MASVANTPRGFHPAFNIGVGDGVFQTHMYKVSADNASALFPGHIVSYNAAGGVESYQTADASTAATQRGALGVVAAVLDTNGKPLTFSQPTKGPYLDASTGGYVMVYDHPDAVFIANCSASASREMFPKFCPISFGANNSAAGISGWGVDAANAVTSATGDQILQIIDVAEAPGSFPDKVKGGAVHNDVYVRIADHHYRRAFHRVGVNP